MIAASTVPGRVALAISFGPLSWQVAEGTLEPGDTNVWRWSGTVDVSTYARVGVGLYELRASAGGCELSGVVAVTGKPVYAAPLGWAAFAVFFAGILLAGRALLSIRRRKGGLVLAAAGGGAIGLGLLLLAQQAGIGEATPWAALTWVVVPSLVGVAIHTVARVVAGGVVVAQHPPGVGAGATVSAKTSPSPVGSAGPLRWPGSGASTPPAPSQRPSPSPAPPPSAAAGPVARPPEITPAGPVARPPEITPAGPVARPPEITPDRRARPPRQRRPGPPTTRPTTRRARATPASTVRKPS